MGKVFLLSFICVLFLSFCIRESSAQCGAGFQDVGGVCMDIDECTENNVPICGSHMCSNTNGSYECICNSGYEVADDNQTCIDIDECSSNSSLCGGNTCINTAGSYQCSCRPGCVNDQNDPQICIDIDECADNYCNQNCVNLDCSSGRYECLCNAGYQLAPDNHTCIDVDECSSNSSLCGGHTCINTAGSYQCSCRLGCMNDPNDDQICIDINECAPANTNDCSQDCNNLDCLSGRYQCSCNPGFRLGVDNHTCIDSNECNTGNNCSQLCINNIGSYTCDCNEGCTLNSDGFSCDDINECDTNNGGCSQVCNNSFCTDGRFSCSCESGYSLHSDGFTCIDIDECAVDNECEQMCNNTNGSFTCSCMEGCTLDANGNTCSDFNECTSNDSRLYCDQICTNANCTDGGYKCSCNTGYILNLDNNRTCLDINECDVDNGGCSQLCLNDPPGSYSCSCRPGYSLEADGVTCTATPCSPKLEAPLNGNYNCSDPADGVTGDICSFSCDDGYDINGSVTRVCQDNSTWTGITTTCTRKSCPPLQATETYLIARHCNTEFGSSCTIFCPYGYYNGTPGADYYQEYCVLDNTGNQLEWGNTDTQCTPLSSPCNPNPCMNNGLCSVQDSLPVCSCSQYFTGQYCETRLLQVLSSLPSLAVGDQSDRLYILTEIGHTDDITVHVIADPTINVSPSPMVSIDPGTGSGNFALRGSSAGAYSIRYLAYSQGSSVVLSTNEQYFIVYDNSDALSSTGLYETEGVLKSPGCCSLNLSDSFCQYWTQSISSSCSVGMDANNTVKTNGISFMHSGGLSLPLSLIGVSVSPSSLSMTPNTDEVLYCTNCTNSSGACLSSDAKNSDSAILARNGTLFKTFLNQAPSLLPSGITLMPTDAAISRNLAMYDFMSDLISDSTHISDECQGLQVNSPTYVLKSNSRISASVNGETMDYNVNDITCFSLALCSLPFSPLTVSLPTTGSSALISSLSGFRYYSNWDWSLSIRSVHLSSNGAINNNDLLFNSLRLWSGSDWITNHSSSFNDVELFVTAGHTSRGDTYDLIVKSNFTGHVSFSLQRQNSPVLLNGDGVLSITALINSAPQSFVLSSQTAQGILFNESNPDFSRGFSVNMNYDSAPSSDFYHDLFPLLDASTPCPVSSFVNLRPDFTPGWVSMYTQCLGLKIHGMTIYGLTTELTFHSSSSFSLYTHNISLTIKAYNNGPKPIRLGKVLSLPNYASTGSYILLNYSTSGDVNGMIRNARLSLYDVDVETIIVVTPTGLTIGLSSGSPQGIYNMNIRGVIHPGDSWDTAGVVIESQLTGSSLSSSFFNQLRSNVHSVLAESGDYASFRLDTVQSNLDSSQETNSSFASSLMALQDEYNRSIIEYQEAVQSYTDAVEASNQKWNVFNATIRLYLSETQIDAVYNAAQCINNCGTDCTMPYSFRPCTSDISLPISGLADFDIPRNQTHRNPSTSQVNSCSSVSDCDGVIGVRWIERQGLVLPVAYDGLDCTNACQSSLFQVKTYADSNISNIRTQSAPVVSSHYNTNRYYTCSLSTCTLQPVSQPCASVYVECDHSRRIQLINEASSVASQASIAALFRISSEYDALLANVSLARAELNNRELKMVLLRERLNLTSAALTSASAVATKSSAPVSSVSELLEREIGIRDWIQAHNSASDVLDVSSLNFTAELTSPSSNRISLRIGYYFPYAPSSSYPLSSNIDLNTPPQFIIDQLTNELIVDARNNNNNNNNNNNGRKRRQQADIDTRGIFLNKCNILQQFMSYVSFINTSLTEAISETTATMTDIASLSSRLQYRYNTIVSNSTSLSMSEQATLQSRENLYLAQAQYQLQQQSLTVSRASIVHWLKPIELYHSSLGSISSLSCYTFTDCLSAISGYIFSELVRIPSASASLYSHKASVNNAIELIAQRSNRAITLSDVQSAMENISTVLRHINDANYWCVFDPSVSSQLPPVMPILEQSSATLHCNVNSSLPIRYQWNKDDIIISNESNSDLTLISFNADDSGLYSCTGITDFETVETLSTQAYLYQPPVLGQTPQRVSTHLYSSKGLRIECTAHSHPLSPSWYWEYAANEGGSWNRIINETSNVLIIRNPSMSDNGYYRCTASTEHGSATSPSIRGTVFSPSVSVPKYNFTITLSSLGSGSGADDTGSEAGLDIIRSYLVRVLASMNIAVSWMGVTAEGDSYYTASFLIAAATVNDSIPHIDELVSWYENQLESLTTQKSLIMNYFSSSLNNNDENVEIISNSLIVSQRKYMCQSGAGLDTDNYIFCVPCDSGYYSEPGFLTDIYRYIKPGTYIKDYLSLCTPCPVGYYQPSTGSTGCISCDPLYSTEGTGSTSSDECKALCQPHYYSVDGLSPCTPCPTSYYQPLYGSTSCLLCNNNTDSLQYCPETTPGGTTTPTDDAEFDVLFVASVAGGSTLALLILCVIAILIIALISRRRSANKKKKSEKDKVVFKFIPRRAGIGGSHNKSGGRRSSKKYSDNPLYLAPDSQEMRVMTGSTSEHSIMKTEMTGLSNIDELSDLERSIDDEPIDSDTVPLYAVPSDEKIEEEVKEGESTSQKEKESEEKENVDEEKVVEEEVVEEEEGEEERVDDEAPLIEKEEKAVTFSDDTTVINQIEETEVSSPTESNEGDIEAVTETIPPPVDMEAVPPPDDMEAVPPPDDMEAVPPPDDMEAVPPPVDMETVPPLVVLETIPPPLSVTDETTTYVIDVEPSPSGEIEPSDDVKSSTSDEIPLEGEEIPTITLVDENNEVIGPPEGGLDDISEDEFIKQMMSTDDTQAPTADQTEPTDHTESADTDPTDADQAEPTDADAAQTDAAQTDADQTDADQTDANQTDANQTDAAQTDAAQTDADQTDANQTDADQTDADQTDADQTDADPTDADPTTITDIDTALDTPQADIIVKEESAAVETSSEDVPAAQIPPEAPENTSEVPEIPKGEETTKEATIPTEDDQPKGESADSKDEEATATTVEGDELQRAIDQALLEAKLVEEAYKEKEKEDRVPVPIPATTDEDTPTEAMKDEESSTPPPPPLSPVPAEQEESAVQVEAPKKKHAIIIVQSDSKNEDEDEDDEGKETLIDDMPSSYSYNIADSEKKLQDIRRKSSPFVGGRANLLRVGEDHLKPASSLPALNVDEDYGDVAKSSASTSNVYN